MFSIMLIPNIGMSFANHGDEGGGGGGGCSGDCTPPTLGKDSKGTIFVENGFTINDKSYDVEYFEQTISTQTILENQPVEITLRVYENSGPQALQHVGIVLGNEYIFDSYVWRHLSNVEISWIQEFDGSQSVKVENNDQLVTDVDVHVQIEEDITVLKFQFTPTMAFDASHIMVKMWDQNKSYWLNNFHDGLEIKSNPFGPKNSDVLTTESDSFGEISEIHEGSIESHEDEAHEEKIRENEHDSHDTELTEEIHCDENSKAIMDSRFGNTFCAPVNIATALIEAGLATLI